MLSPSAIASNEVKRSGTTVSRISLSVIQILKFRTRMRIPVVAERENLCWLHSSAIYHNSLTRLLLTFMEEQIRRCIHSGFPGQRVICLCAQNPNKCIISLTFTPCARYETLSGVLHSLFSHK